MTITLPRIFVLNPNATAAMTDQMVVSMGEVIGTQAELVGMTNLAGPAAIEGPKDGRACLPGLMQLSQQALTEGADAIIIGCFDDTGVGDLRQKSSVPIIGLGEAGCLAATLIATRFGVVTTLDISIPMIAENIATMGLSPRCDGIWASGVAVLGLIDGETEIRAQITTAMDAHPGIAIVLGCAGMTTIAPRLALDAQTRLIDPVRAAAGMALGVIGATF